MDQKNEKVQEVIDFLIANEQYGDDWKDHIEVLSNCHRRRWSDNFIYASFIGVLAGITIGYLMFG